MAHIEQPCLEWRKSTASNSGACVEVAALSRSVLVRDSMDRNGPVLQLPPAVWSAFLSRARSTDASIREA